MTVNVINTNTERVITETCVKYVDQTCRYITVWYDRRYKPTSVSKSFPVDGYAIYSITE